MAKTVKLRKIITIYEQQEKLCHKAFSPTALPVGSTGLDIYAMAAHNPYFSGLFRESYDKYINQARWNNGMISHMPDGAPELHYIDAMSYEEYLSALVPKERQYDRYAGAWNEMLAEGFDAFLGLGLIYKAVTGEEAFTGDKLTQNEREVAAASGAFALTVSVLTSAIGGTGWSGFATMLLADAAGGVVGVVTYEGLTNMGLSDSEAFLLSFFAGVITGNGIERMAYSSPTYIDDLAKRMGKSPEEVSNAMRRLSDIAGTNGYSSVDDLLRHIDDLPTGVYDDIIDIVDKPMGSFNLKKESRFFKNSQTDDVVTGRLEYRYSVDSTMFPDDEAAGVLRNGEYVKNPTAHNINDYVCESSNYLGNKNMNGQYMYVIDMDGNIIIGTRGGQRMPHPTLVSGRNPQVQAAGMVEIRGGKIYSINNSSGHFKPSVECLEIAEDAFSKLPQKIFSKDFQGYLPYGK